MSGDNTTNITVEMGGWSIPAFGYRIDHASGTLEFNLAGRFICGLFRRMLPHDRRYLKFTYIVRNPPCN